MLVVCNTGDDELPDLEYKYTLDELLKMQGYNGIADVDKFLAKYDKYIAEDVYFKSNKFKEGLL